MFPKKHRLAKTKDIQMAFAKGRSFFNSWIIVRYMPDEEITRLTVVVSTKVSKKAVARNRFKRIIRECLRLRLGSLKKGNYIISVKPQAAKQAEPVLLRSLEELLVLKKLLTP